MRETYYQNKSQSYGIGHTRLKRILDLVGDISDKRVLDVGCASGYLGRLIKEKGNYVAGIEISQTAADAAKKVLDKVYVFNIEELWPDELQKQKFDLVILAETLEHVFNPVEVLSHVVPILNNGGEVIITTPNFMIWTNRVKFLFGNFQYQNQGMFDFGHIRFFTYNYLIKVLKESGLKIETENHIIFPGKLTSFLKHWPSLFVFQFILKVKKI